MTQTDTIAFYIICLCLILMVLYVASKYYNITSDIICEDKNIYTPTQQNISCIICYQGNEKYMDCDFDKTNRNLRGIFYR